MYTVLLADDSASVRALACAVLGSAGYSVLPAEDGAEALALARAYAGAIDLLVTDIAMPRVGGIALRAAFAEFRPATPVLFMSGDPANAMAGEHFLSKPFTPGQLMSAVARLLAAARPAGADTHRAAIHNTGV